MSKDRFILLNPGEVRPTRVPVPPVFGFKARTEDTEGRLSLLEVILARDIPRHVHHMADECIYVLDGVLEVEFDDRVEHVAAGGFVLLPHGVPHALRRGSAQPPRVIQISTPGGWECYIEDLAEAGPDATTTDGQFDPKKLNPIAARYEITYEEQ
ncbi:cupin domain-containing protein [Nonomuraea turcica]|uniref:cupin domain-containing protein n=1 Tax=Nonomuraea sp. G32 TaxID=3067274 RepID=UPI00273CD909|nr:cupin domain-containing protein [Nonomuraea sp. G32]MDP4511020.1 cupin domain-containing protein [Nonomuraea sp. G32]